MSGRKSPNRSKNKIKVQFWDTCVFLAWIKNEQCWPKDVVEGISQGVEDLEHGRLRIVTSRITLLELLDGKDLQADQRTLMKKVFQSPNIQPMDLDLRVTELASEIRLYYDDRVFDAKGDAIPPGRIIGLGDAIQLATAIQYQIAEFVTLDGLSNNPKKYSLLTLGSKIAGKYPIRIFAPKYIPPPPESPPIQPTSQAEQMPLALHIGPGDKNTAITPVLEFLKVAIDQGVFKSSSASLSKETVESEPA
jgi:hypothetical protein